MSLPRFTDASGRKLAINPAHVAVVTPVGTGSTTDVHLAADYLGGRVITLDEDFEAVVRKLSYASRVNVEVMQ